MPKFLAEGDLMGKLFCPTLNACDGNNGQSGSFALPDAGRAALPRRPNFDRAIISGWN
jgi:hypothetical protein